MWASTFPIHWTWVRWGQLASSQGRSFYQRWPHPHLWHQMWRLKVSWVPMATRTTTRSTPHCCVSLSFLLFFFLPTDTGKDFCLPHPFYFSDLSVFTRPYVAFLLYRNEIINNKCRYWIIWWFSCNVYLCHKHSPEKLGQAFLMINVNITKAIC